VIASVDNESNHPLFKLQEDTDMASQSIFSENRLRRPNPIGPQQIRLESLDLTGARLQCGSRLFVLVGGRILQHDPCTHEVTGTLSVISQARLANMNSRACLRLGPLEFEINVMQSRLAELRGEQAVHFMGRLAQVKPVY
jgi:hypothetical protein